MSIHYSKLLLDYCKKRTQNYKNPSGHLPSGQRPGGQVTSGQFASGQIKTASGLLQEKNTKSGQFKSGAQRQNPNLPITSAHC